MGTLFHDRESESLEIPRAPLADCCERAAADSELAQRRERAVPKLAEARELK
jgi:hypothetical protein